MLVNIFKAVLITSLAGTSLALVLTAFKPITRRFFSSSWHYFMWLSVLIVMLVPVSIRLPEKPRQAAEPITVETELAANTIINTSPQEPVLTDAADSGNRSDLPEAVPTDVMKLLAMLWLAAAAALFSARLAGYAAFLVKLKKSSAIVSCPELAEFTKRKITTRISSIISSPFMTGIFKPVLVLPKAEFTPEQLHNILAHEMTHFKRNDIRFKWLAAAVKCIHWFNPAVYFICGRINKECEISCDSAVIRNMTREQESDYIETILSLLSLGNSKPAPLTTGMAGSKKSLKERFIMIRNKKKISRKAVVLSAVLAVVTLASTAFAVGIVNGSLNGNNSAGTDMRERGGFNALVMGIDEGGRADSVAVLSVRDSGISWISIPRNTDYDGKHISNLSAEENGCEKAVDAVREMLSIPINYYARIETDAVENIVDAAGGVKFDVPMDMEYDDPYKNLHINLAQGRQLLDGEKAAQLLRFRNSNVNEAAGYYTGYENGDLTRIEVGQAFTKALAEKLLDTGAVNNAAEIYKAVSDKVVTNYSLSDLISDAPMLKDMDNISFSTLPGKEEPSENGVSYMINFTEAEALLDVFRN